MREILFRGKRADNNEWVYGSYHCLVGDAKMREAIWGGDYRIQHRQLDAHYILERILPDTIGWDIKGVIVAHHVNTITVGQFTGLAKNNIRIYEGDFISLANFIYEVRFEDGKFVGYHVNNREWGRWGDLKRLFDIDFKNYEWNVIGNIHDNPELISQPATT